MTTTAEGAKARSAQLEALLFEPRDAAALAAFRVLFGVVMAVSTARFLAYGWVEELYVAPRFLFTYWGFGWVRPLPGPAMVGLHVALLVASVCVAAGLWYRVAIAAFALGFTYLQLLDVTNYLNHYYLVTLLGWLLVALPLGRVFSVDAWRKPGAALTHLPAWMTYLLRLQVGIVYVFAGLAKANGDWLFHAQPLNLWLSARTHVPLVGPLLDEPATAYAMSWAGFLFDTWVVAFLSWRPPRLWAYAVVLAFHAATQLLFPIGMFPTIMVTSALVFFPATYPRDVAAWVRRQAARLRLMQMATAEPPSSLRCLPLPTPPRRRALVVALAAFAAVQIALPLRTHLYGGNVLWHEQGMRFSWRVMLREKNGAVSYVVETGTRTFHVSPREYLTDRQLRDFSGQPDLILQLAHRIAADYRARGHGDVRVHGEALVSLNGRPAAPLIDPAVDLAQTRDGLAPYSWVLPAPSSDPIHLRPLAWAR